jgi:cell wall-associated NlpC family hydrolase
VQRLAIGTALVVGALVFRGWWPGSTSVLAQAPAALQVPTQAPAGERPRYNVAFTFQPTDLVNDLQRTERGDARRESEVPHAEWYSRRVSERWHGWGPPARHYPPLPGSDEWPVERKRQRVIAVALHFVGYGYQHHHVPDWDPPADWEWKHTCVGHNGKGVDCSNYTSFVYNLGFGIKLNSEVHHQAAERQGAGPGAQRKTPLRRIELPESYKGRIQTLKSGDLVFIRNNEDKISHVVIWVGSIGQSEEKVPLILDSHGGEVRDDQGKQIPCGVQLRPFREKSWYNKDASHAIRVFNDEEKDDDK